MEYIERDSGPFPIFIGWDRREDVAYEVCRYSIQRHSSVPVNIIPLKHKELRKKGWFHRPWLIEAHTGNWRDLVDCKPFSTEFSHTRFLIPALCEYNGWAMFCDCDMLFTADIAELFEFIDDKYAVMVVKHDHRPPEDAKMDGQSQDRYHRKNWSSVILWNCGHEANKSITPHLVNGKDGGWMHGFTWLEDSQIGSINETWNWLEGHNELPTISKYPKNIHFTRGGPWMPEWKDVTYAERWVHEYEHWQRNGNHDEKAMDVPTMKYGG